MQFRQVVQSLSSKHRRLLYSVGLFLLLLIPALWNLSGAEIAEWDEGLAVRHARNALQNHVWLVPTRDDGSFSRAFSKPPLLLWQVAAGIKLLGATAWGMRVGTALALVGSALVARQLAKRGGLHEVVATLWAVLIVVCGGALKWARVVNIEITLVLFNLLALYCYARALDDSRRGLRWAVLTGIALCGAFLTKQLVCGLAAAPLIVIEVFLYSSQDRRRAVLRLAVAGGIAVLVAGAWWAYASAKSKGRVADSMVEFTLVQRMKGLRGGQHVNFLNRLGDEVKSGLAPFRLEVAALGWGLLLFRSFRDSPKGIWLVFLYMLGSILVFGFISASILPWYCWSVVVPLLLGIAYLLGEGLRQAYGWLSEVVLDPRAPLPQPSLELGALALSVCAIVTELLYERVNQFGWILSSAALFALAVGLLRRLPQLAARVAIASALVAWPAASVAFAMSTRAEYHGDPGPLLSLAAPASRAGLHRVAVERGVAGGENRYQAVFGPKATSERRPPWSDKNRRKFDAYVQSLQLPNEYAPPKGVFIDRSAGLVLWRGDLSRTPYDDSTLATLLKRGALTYEAQWASSKLTTSLDTRDGVTVRSALYRDANRYHTKTETLLEVDTTTLPQGRYRWSVQYDARCAKVRRMPSGRVEVRAGGRSLSKVTLSCNRTGMSVVGEAITLERATELELVVKYQSGNLWVASFKVELDQAKEKEKKARAKTKIKPKKNE